MTKILNKSKNKLLRTLALSIFFVSSSQAFSSTHCSPSQITCLKMKSGQNNGRQIVGVHMDSPSAERNKAPIWKVLSSSVLSNFPDNEPFQVLEVAAGAGVHTVFFADNILKEKPKIDLKWIPSDPDYNSLSSITAWVKSNPNTASNASIKIPPKQLTLDENGFIEQTNIDFEPSATDLMICINMIHISPWEATLGLMKEASKQLKPNSGYLYCYGPYLSGGTGAASNIQFDASLKFRNSKWGVRNLEDVVKVAESNGLTLSEKIEMPRENLSLIFRKL